MDPFDEQQQRHERNNEVVRRELERRALDTIRVYNPLDRVFRYKWDSRNFSVPSKGTADVERYLAEAFAQKIIEHMIGLDQMTKGTELLALRQKQLGKTFLDKYEENKEVWDRVPRLNDRELIEQYGGIVVLGLVEEYGMEEIPEDLSPIEKQDTPYDSLKKHMDRRIIDGEPMERFSKDA